MPFVYQQVIGWASEKQDVRERKGLKSDKKIVIAAEKQRTLARKK